MKCIIGADSSALPKGLIQAYMETEYRCAELDLLLRIGQTNPNLTALYERCNCETAAYITACNPWGQELDEQQNAERQDSLRAMLSGQGYELWKGVGAHPAGDWTPEPSFLVLGISLDAACNLGRYWEQNAIVWCNQQAVPGLVLLR